MTFSVDLEHEEVWKGTCQFISSSSFSDYAVAALMFATTLRNHHTASCLGDLVLQGHKPQILLWWLVC